MSRTDTERRSGAVRAAPSSSAPAHDPLRALDLHDPLQARQADGGLPAGIQAQMGGHFGHDFSDVKVHASSSAATALGAEAFTQGNDVHFAPGRYDPVSSGGQELIGHELAHVVQQREGRVQPKARLGAGGPMANVDADLEAEADARGRSAARGESPGRTQKKGSSAGNGVAQPMLGFEIEMLVLIDQKGRPLPEKVYAGKYGSHLEISVDQNAAVEGIAPTKAKDAGFELPVKDPLKKGVKLGAYDLPPNWKLLEWVLVDKADKELMSDPDRSKVQLAFEKRNAGGYLKRIDKLKSWVNGKQEDIEKLVDLDAQPGRGKPSGYRLMSAQGVKVEDFDLSKRKEAEKKLADRSQGDRVVPVYEDPGGNETIDHPIIGAGGDKYASIVEIVTKAYPPETKSGYANIVKAMTDAKDLATAIETKTAGLTKRAKLKDVATAANDEIHIGNDGVPNQTTDASIQSTFAVDIAKLPAYFAALQKRQQEKSVNRPFDLKHHSDNQEDVKQKEMVRGKEIEVVTHKRTVRRAREEAIRAPSVATAIIDGTGRTTGVGLGKKTHTLENLRGLLTLMCQYLLMGRFFYDDPKDTKGGLDKNLAALLSRTNLSAVFKSLPDDERAYVGEKFNTLLGKTKSEAKRTGASTLFTDPSETVKYDLITTTVDGFVTNVFKKGDDEVTSKFGGFHLMDAESIDPEKKRSLTEKDKKAPVFELRNMIETGGDRFKKDKWKGLAEFQAGVLKALNALEDADARKDITLDMGDEGIKAVVGESW